MTRDDLRARLEREIAELVAAEGSRLLALMGSVDGWDSADPADSAAREMDLQQAEARIDRLRARLAALDRAPGEPEAGPASSTAVLDFGDGPETHLLAAFPYDGMPVVTPHSPLGRALVGARAGQAVSYSTPHGQATVVVVALGTAPGESAA